MISVIIIATLSAALLVLLLRKPGSDPVLLERALTAEAELKMLKESRQGLEERFGTIASEIVNKNSVRFREESEREIKLVMNPLKEFLGEFKTRVDSIHSTDIEQRAKLEQKLAELSGASMRLSDRAENLSKAISGDVKAQGTWGEVRLEDLLEQCGLSKGNEFFPQAEGMGLKFEDGKSARPDFVILLPGKRHLIVDSKVSLESYLRACSAETAELKKAAAKELAVSMRRHFKGLSEKAYDTLEGINAPGSTIMFVPFEGALSLAAEEDPALIKDALDKNVVFATPTSLFAMMRAIHMIWTQERQNRNVLDIAERAGLLYDKFVDFYSDLNVVSKNLRLATDSFDEARKKIGSGKGNLVNQTEELKRLGARAKKALPAKDTEKALNNHELDIGAEQPEAASPTGFN